MVPLAIFWKSLLVGFCVAVPVGPVGILVIRRSLAHGWRWGLLVGLAAALADGLYAAIATRGLNFVSRAIHEHGAGLSVGGGLLMLFLGAQMMFQRAKTADGTAGRSQTIARDAFSAFLLMLANPATILIFLALLATLGIRVERTHSASAIIAGVAAGSTVWWIILSMGSSAFRHRLTEERVKAVDQVAGALVAAFGALRLIQGLLPR